MNKKLFDTSKLQNVEWGNIELPGITDEELHSKKWQQVRKDITDTTQWKSSHSKGIEKRSDSTWKENVTKGNQKKYTDEYLAKHRERIKKRTDSDKFKKAVKANGIKRRKPVMTPDGVFDSRKAAADHYKCACSWIGALIKKYPGQYYYI